MEGDRAARGGDPPPSEGDPVTTPLATKAPRLTWTDSRLQTLLHLRLIVYGDAFNKHKSRAQLTVLWSRALRRFNKKHGTKAVVDQLRNKFNAMKELFGQIRADEVATGNLARVVKYPSYWSILVEFFVDKKGLRNQDFGQSETPLPPFSAAGSDDDAAASDWGGDAASDGDIAVGEIHDDSSSDEADAAAVETEKDRHNSMKKRQKLDLPEAMVSMGTLIAKAMAGPEHVPDTANISVQLSEIQETQKKIVLALENSANVNAQLLQFLQSKMD